MQKIKCAIIGADSYLFAGLEKRLGGFDVFYTDFKSWNKNENLELLKKSDIIANFSAAPEISSKKMDFKDIIDVNIAEKISNSKARFVFISSRKIYGTSAELKVYKETDAPAPFDFYSENKIKTEIKLAEILQNRLCVLRISNVIGEPVRRLNYKTFAGWTSENFLKNGKIAADKSGEEKKDFISKKFLHKNLAAVLEKQFCGTYNLSAGFAVKTLDLLRAMVGKENVSFDENAPVKEQFVLDNSKIKSVAGIDFCEDDIFNAAEEFRKKLFILGSL